MGEKQDDMRKVESDDPDGLNWTLRMEYPDLIMPSAYLECSLPY